MSVCPDAPQNLTISVFWGEGTGPEALGNGSSLPVQQGHSLRLVCVADSNPPPTMSWTLGSLTLTPSSPSNPGVLELPRVQLGHHGKYVCRAWHLLGSLEAALSLFVTSERDTPGEGHLAQLVHPGASNPTSALKTLTNPCRVQMVLSILPSPLPGPSLPSFSCHCPHISGEQQGLETPMGRGLQGVTEPLPPGGAEVWDLDP
ncbi:hypothetical protein HPG69_014055 [Diceros bicornis minor]|uniref:Ig-like domain-containing protein n=1 Tax=Diceros bicornis minor TaxID=77932 RepID=A0A7J7ENF0_DICBM|nr:hypothetical protein HPG69_014055 [Diceros bicornis minor]